MRELQELKRVRRDQDTDTNPWSLRIQAKVVPPNLRVSKEKFDGMTGLAYHVPCFESTLDLYGVSDVIKCRAFPTNFKGIARFWYDSLPF